MNRYTEEDIKKAIEKGSFGLEGYLVYRCMLFTPNFFNDDEKTVTIVRVKNVRGSGYQKISYEELFSQCEKLTTQEARKHYPSLVW